MAQTPRVEFVLFADRQAPLRARLALAAAAAETAGHVANHGQPLRQVLPAPALPRGRDLDLRRREHPDPGGPDARSSPSSPPRAPTSGSSRTSSASTSSRSSSSARRWARSRPRTPRRAGRSSRTTAPRACRRTISSPRTRSSSAAHGNPALAAAMDLWWAQLETYTRRDQLSLPYVLYKSRPRGEALGLELQVREPLLPALPAPARRPLRPERAPEEQAPLQPLLRRGLRRHPRRLHGAEAPRSPTRRTDPRAGRGLRAFKRARRPPWRGTCWVSSRYRRSCPAPPAGRAPA